LGVQYRSKEVTLYDVIQMVKLTDDNLSTKAGISTSVEIVLEYPLSTDRIFGSFSLNFFPIWPLSAYNLP
jgi:hypothetical protein